MIDRFRCLTSSPINLADAGLAIATARAGGVALLDREFCRDAELSLANRNLASLLKLTGGEAEVGLRLRVDQITSSQTLLDQLSARAHWLILCDGNAQSWLEVKGLLSQRTLCTLLVEFTDARQLSNLPNDLPLHGLIARGNESGGWVGEDSAFILSQKLLTAQAHPVYVQGGIGIHSAAACRAAGAAGVVLDDQLLLMPESPLPVEWKQKLDKLHDQETILMGERLGAACRVLSRPEFRAVATLRQYVAQAELEGYSGEAAKSISQSWRETATARLGWGPPETHAWPIGQATGLASSLAVKFKTTGRLVQAVLNESGQHVRVAQQYLPLKADGPMADSHGTRYPIVQGPMTRVSDSARFADSVSRAGGLPLLALALMTRAQVMPLLAEVRDLLGERPFGVGILGFVPPDLRAEQIAAVVAARPRFALIAGGRPDQATQLEAHGIATYLHVPVPSLLKMFLEQGARRFVFEGRECGGHVGPLTSFMLWESAIEILLEKVAPGAAEEVHVLFAGGIHDRVSGAMVSAMAAPLAERGFRVGVLMGTAYLFTEEAVSCGAIVKTFQDQALACDRTVNLETGPGHAIRCVATPFAEEFYSTRREALGAGASAAETRQILESLTTGRLRIASKGVDHGKDKLTPVAESEQLRRGMYMIGQVATMHSTVRSMEELHREVSEQSAELLLSLSPKADEQIDIQVSKPADIAIIGISTLLPKAHHPREFWDNLLRQVGAISEIPPDRWDWRLYFDRERKARDKTYSKWGGFIDDVAFDPLRYGIPPNSLASISCAQLLALEAVQRALQDAGYPAGDFDREKTSVILGCDGGGNLGHQYVTRAHLPLFVESHLEQTWDRLPEWTEESFPGTLTNVTAGRVANRFDLGGSNYTVDAACASSLTAVDLAIQELESGRSNVVITGGIDTGQSPYFYIAFSKTQALSPTGATRTFDQGADGIVISEGVAIVVLKRLADAERDGDRIYAVIKSVATSSDGRALGLTAPRAAGQSRAFARAYRKAQIAPRTLGLYEAHGTGTVLGDRTELETITSMLRDDQTPGQNCAIGSVKTLVGHTKTAAGVVGLVKAALALYHKVLPPHAGVDNPLELIAADASPVYLLTERRPWFAHPEYPRRSGVSAFGFGGTNAHAVLEEYRGASRERAPGAERWPLELLVLKAADRKTLAEEVRRLRAALESGAEPRLRDLAFSYAVQAQVVEGMPADRSVSVSLVVEDLDQLKTSLTTVLAALESEAPARLPTHLMLGDEQAPAVGRIAFAFPGQGSQYPNMAREAAVYFGELRTAIEHADRQLRPWYPKLLSQYIYPPAAFTEAGQRSCEAVLCETHIAQSSIGAVSLGFLDLALRLGIKPDVICGHSYGEITALYAAGALSREDFFSLSEIRGRRMAAVSDGEGTMAVVYAARDDVAARLKASPEVVIANHNAPLQTVISGPRRAVTAVIEQLRLAGLSSSLLPVAGAFHSALMKSAEAPLREAIDGIGWRPPQLPVYSNVTARPYDTDEDNLRAQLARHLLSPVEFVKEIEQMYADGARVFIELGPKRVLTELIDRILEGREHLSVSLDGKSGGLRDLLLALGTLIARGVNVNLTALFAGREVERLDLTRLAETTIKPVIPRSSWLVNGATARPQTETRGARKLPPLNKDTASSTVLTPMRKTDSQDANSPSAPTAARIEQGGGLTNSSRALGAPGSSSSAEILTAYEAYQQTMRQFIALQEQALKCFLDGQKMPASLPLAMTEAFIRVADPAVHESSVGEAPDNNRQDEASVAVPQTNPAEIVDQKSLTERLVHLIAERTGYPPETLGLDLDLESELGVDSIKRIEILHELQQTLPPRLAARMVDGMESFTRVKSLNTLVQSLLLELKESPPAVNSIAEQSTIAPAVQSGVPGAYAEDLIEDISPASQDLCPRWVLEAREEPLIGFESALPEGLFLITEDKLSVAQRVLEALRQRGARAAILGHEVLSSPDELEKAVTELQRQAPVRGIVHLAALAALNSPKTLAEWRGHTRIQSKSLFQLLKLCASSLLDSEAAVGRVLSATVLGGSFGRDGKCGPGLPTGASSYGLLNSLKSEWPKITAHAIDFDHRLSPEQMTELIIDELLNPAGRPGVGYPGSTRTVFYPVESALDVQAAPPGPAPTADWVVLVSGGARGITAEVVRRWSVPGMKMIIVGRSPEPAAEGPETAGVERPDELRRIYLNRAGTAGKAKTPAQVERQIKGLLEQRAIRRNLGRLRQKGVQVEYHALDVRTNAFAVLIDLIYSRHGRLDAVIHGAGIIEDKQLLGKSQSSFDRVFDTKVDSAYILSRHLRADSLKLVVLFSSVAARIGNAGQTDYAAANEVLNCFAGQMSQDWPQARVVAINWGPWEEVGMASDVVNRRFKTRGIVPISPDAGSDFFLREVLYGGPESVEVIAGEGPWRIAAVDPVSLDDLGEMVLHLSTLAEDFWAM